LISRFICSRQRRMCFIIHSFRFCSRPLHAVGVEPRFGVTAFTSPTLFAPDLELRLLGPEWQWLAWAEVVLGLTILPNHNGASWSGAIRSCQRRSARPRPPLLRGLLLLRRVQC
jgi:hypothetical protein